MSGPRKTSRPGAKKSLVTGRVTAINGKPARGVVFAGYRPKQPARPVTFKAKPGLGGRRHRLRRAKAARLTARLYTFANVDYETMELRAFAAAALDGAVRS